jgi:threonine dehydrogenase-like Zn-dependent dehydrogenase
LRPAISATAARWARSVPEIVVRDVDAGGMLFPIPDDLPFDRAALAEPLGVGMHAVERLGLAPGEKVAIFGAGPIG